MNKIVMVTGGAGFIGSSLVRKLTSLDYQVIVLDNFVNGKIKNLPASDKIKVIQGDITDQEDIKKCLLYHPTYLVHLAAYHFIPFCNLNPAETVRVNIYGTQKILDIIGNNQTIKKIINASTAAVYAPKSTVCDETDEVSPVDIYGITKKTCEDLMNLFQRSTGISVINARIFNAIGPRETNPHLIPDIITEIKKGSSDIQLGNITTRRDYIHVDDISSAIIKLLESDVKIGQFNIGTGNAYSAKELVDLINLLFNMQLNIKTSQKKLRKSDRPFLSADNKKLSALGWDLKYSINDSIKDTLHYYGIK